MSVSLDVLNNVRVASPCTVPWDSMTGDNRVRHCGECKLNVYNFAEMTSQEVLDLIIEKEGRLCGRLFRRTDGTMITSDCPVGLAAKLRKRFAGLALRVAAVILAAAGAYTFLVSGSAKSQRGGPVTQIEPLATLHRWLDGGTMGRPIAGKMVCPPLPAPPSAQNPAP